jgi:DNA-binding IclR family transcriptional regulator
MTILNSATEVLRLLARGERDLTVTDVVNGLAMPKSSASRLLKQMMEAGLLERNATSLAYRPALLILELSHQVRASTPLLKRMEHILEAMVRETGHTGYISVLDETGEHVVVMRVIHGSLALRVVTWPGHRSPAYATATGRALLARLDDETIRQRFAATPMAELSTRSPQNVGELIARVEQVRRCGWALALDEALPGVGSISCSVADPNSRETLAFCLSFPAPAGEAATVQALQESLLGHARSIGRAAGDSFWTALS